MNSHIQTPKFLLKNFATTNNKLFYYDVQKHFIGKNGSPRSINTKKDYYSEDVEQLLNNIIEKPFSELTKRITDAIANNTAITIDVQTFYVVIKYLYALLGRDPEIMEAITLGSCTSYMLSPQIIHDISVLQMIKILGNEKIFYNKAITLAINKTETPFILPVCGVATYRSKGILHFHLPISPKIAITVFDRDSTLNVQDIHVYNVEKQEDVRELNYRSFRAQCAKNWGYVVSSDFETLDAAKNRYEKTSLHNT